MVYKADRWLVLQPCLVILWVVPVEVLFSSRLFNNEPTTFCHEVYQRKTPLTACTHSNKRHCFSKVVAICSPSASCVAHASATVPSGNAWVVTLPFAKIRAIRPKRWRLVIRPSKTTTVDYEPPQKNIRFSMSIDTSFLPSTVFFDLRVAGISSSSFALPVSQSTKIPYPGLSSFRPNSWQREVSADFLAPSLGDGWGTWRINIHIVHTYP